VVKRPESEADHVPLSSDEGKNKGSYISAPLCDSMAYTWTNSHFMRTIEVD
jgi:hypothetical protein